MRLAAGVIRHPGALVPEAVPADPAAAGP
jgi:hypothetical protein